MQYVLCFIVVVIGVTYSTRTLFCRTLPYVDLIIWRK